MYVSLTQNLESSCSIVKHTLSLTSVYFKGAVFARILSFVKYCKRSLRIMQYYFCHNKRMGQSKKYQSQLGAYRLVTSQTWVRSFKRTCCKYMYKSVDWRTCPGNTVGLTNSLINTMLLLLHSDLFKFQVTKSNYEVGVLL